MKGLARVWRTLIRGCVRLVFAFVVLSLLLVALFRYVSPPSSAFMLAARWDAWWHQKVDRQIEYEWVAADRMSPQIRRAILAAEDQRFFDHHGFDWQEIRSAMRERAQGGRLRGASTISQQTAKNLFLWRGRSWLRKGLEVWFTGLIELCWPKERILEVYLNLAQFGPQTYGVQAAARIYFRKDAMALTRDEAALLAAVLPNPTRLQVAAPSPYVARRARAIQRQMSHISFR
ncbi:MAG: monofunctional biosynthetic peptidoglycan transglycosylase [Gammaproteobacteria bacterium]|nr:monofunctional biosynthetic peptidoglycan transglycosylase [Gammaproteobacteria bacterium]